MDIPEPLYECESCFDKYPIGCFHLNFPDLYICDSCSLVVIRCERCFRWNVDERCICNEKKDET